MVEKDAAILRKKGLLEAYFPSTHNNLFTVTLLLLLLQHHTLVHQHAYVKEVHFEIIVIQIPLKRNFEMWLAEFLMHHTVSTLSEWGWGNSKYKDIFSKQFFQLEQNVFEIQGRHLLVKKSFTSFRILFDLLKAKLWSLLDEAEKIFFGYANIQPFSKSSFFIIMINHSSSNFTL